MSDKPFQFLLYGIECTQFAAFPEVGDSKEVENIRLNLTFDVDPGKRCVGVLPLLRLEKKGGEVLAIVQVRISFEVSPDDWPRLFDDANTIRIPTLLARHFGVVAVGTGRGVFHEKVQAFPSLRELMWPLIDLTNIVADDVVLSSVTEE